MGTKGDFRRCSSGLRAVTVAALALGIAPLGAAPQSLSDAWWTGPLLAPNAATLPVGHVYLEPYLYDALPYARLDAAGRSRPAPYANNFGSLTYLSYGWRRRLTVGIIPRFGYARPADAPGSSGVGIGDLTVQAQYRLTPLDPHSPVPIASINLQETLPTGRYQRLGRFSDGLGAGAYTTTLSLYFMSYFWLPNGRILRARLDLSYARSSRVALQGRSVYGTPAGFQGEAWPGDSAFGDLGLEYSLSRHWVLACDLWAEQDAATRVGGTVHAAGAPARYASNTGVGRVLYVAPAFEYNWSARLGVIFGVRVTAAGRNQTATVTPVAALSYFD